MKVNLACLYFPAQITSSLKRGRYIYTIRLKQIEITKSHMSINHKWQLKILNCSNQPGSLFPSVVKDQKDQKR